MDHNEIRHRLSEYIDNAVSPQERAEIDKHLRTCSTCTDALAELRKTIEAVKQIEEVDAPAWMTQKIMANVRAEAERKNSIFHRLFYPLAIKLPIQVVGMLFLTVTAYYIYTSMNPADKHADIPVGRMAKLEAPSPEQDAVKRRAPEAADELEKKVSQEPGYRSLDMKYSYEKPEAPVPAEKPAAPAAGAVATPTAPAASAPAPVQRAMPMMAKDETAHGAKKAARAAAPSMMSEQAAPAEGKSNVPAPADHDAEARLAVAERFAQKDLPKSMKTKGLRYDVRRFQADLPDLQWMLGSSVYRSKPCSDRYVIDVEHSGRLTKYLYCYEKTGVQLLGVFELKKDTWTEIK